MLVFQGVSQPFGIRIIEHLRYRPFSTFRPFELRQFRCFTHYFSAQPFASIRDRRSCPQKLRHAYGIRFKVKTGKSYVIGIGLQPTHPYKWSNMNGSYLGWNKAITLRRPRSVWASQSNPPRQWCYTWNFRMLMKAFLQPKVGVFFLGAGGLQSFFLNVCLATNSWKGVFFSEGGLYIIRCIFLCKLIYFLYEGYTRRIDKSS